MVLYFIELLPALKWYSELKSFLVEAYGLLILLIYENNLSSKSSPICRRL